MSNSHRLLIIHSPHSFKNREQEGKTDLVWGWITVGGERI
jgi:hypothetical protein